MLIKDHKERKNKEVEIIRPKIINVILGLDLCEGN
jgi:hypothetical protein